jgi:hypothetical protein
MIKADQFCSDFARDHLHLSPLLRRRERTVHDVLSSVTSDQLLEGPASAVTKWVLSQPRVVEGDQIGVLRAVSVDPPVFNQDVGVLADLRGEDFNVWIPCWRWLVTFSWVGPLEFGYWPDEYGTELAIFENHSQLGYPHTVKWGFGPGKLVAACFMPQSSNQADHPEALYELAITHVEAYTRAFSLQVDAWEDRLFRCVHHKIEERQALVRRGRAVRDRVSEKFRGWRVGPLRVDPQGGDLEEQVQTRIPAGDLPAPLTDASLEEITMVLNRWVQAIEKYPAAFLTLEEERLSDLLVATLNAAFVRAEREVFIGSGKSDFYVTSASIGEDGTAEVFVGETKFWTGRQRFRTAIGQTLENLTHRTRSAVLLVVVKDRRSFVDAKVEGLRSLEKDDRVVAKASDIATCPSYWLRSALDPKVQVRMCVVWVDLTKSPESLPRPKGRVPRRAT